MSQEKSVADWMHDGDYLPECMRDFSDAKAIFKRVWEIVERKKANDRLHSFNLMPELNWVNAHVFTTDFFLWFMAAHGYTLQKTRKRGQFDDLKATMDEFHERCMDALAAMINARTEDLKNEQHKATEPPSVGGEHHQQRGV